MVFNSSDWIHNSHNYHADMTGLYVDSVIKSFDNKQILTDIYLTCKEGEIIGLLGRNGSGKSTLLQIIFGSLKADTKFIKINDRIVNHLHETHNQIKYLPQDNFLPRHLKTKRIISLFCDNDEAERITNNGFIKPLLDKKVRDLSGGEKRLIEILLILYSSAKFILVDEPFTGIAPIYIETIKDIIREQSKSKGLIVTDHDYLNIYNIATRIIMIYDGGIKEIQDKKELKYWGYIPESA